MIRTLAFSFAAALALTSAAFASEGEVFPAVHNDPITVRILNGRNGQPLGHQHLILIGGYDRQDMHAQAYREEVITDAAGRARLSNQMENLPWIQVWVDKKALCQRHPRTASFSVDQIRRDGLSAPNWCGTVTVEDAPGAFTVFVKGKRGDRAAAVAPLALAPVPASASAASARAAQDTTPAVAQAADSGAPCGCANARKAGRGAAVCNRVGAILDGVTRTLW